MNQRFSQITDKLFQKGYNLYPFSDAQEIRKEENFSIIKGTHQRNSYEQKYLITIPKKELSPLEIQAIRNLPNPNLQIFEIEKEYIAWKDIVDVNTVMLDKMLAKSIRESNKDPASTNKKVFMAKRETQAIPLQKKPTFNMARFRQITDKLTNKGYSLYPFNEKIEIEITVNSGIVIGKYEKETFYIIVPHQKLSAMILQSIRNVCIKNAARRLYDLDPEYLVFVRTPLLKIEKIDNMISQFRDLHTDTTTDTERKKLLHKNRQTTERRLRVMLPKIQATIDPGKTGKYAETSAYQNKLDVYYLENNTVDGYNVLQKLGEGGFGLVYLVEKTHKYYILKIARPGRGEQDIEEEIESINRLTKLMQSPEYKKIPRGIPKIFHTGYLQGVPYFIEEFVITLDVLKNIIYRDSRVLKFNPILVLKEYYQRKAGEALRDLKEQERCHDLAAMVDHKYQNKNRIVPMDPLVSAQLALQLMHVIHMMNAHNYHYGDLKAENVGIRFHNMEIIRHDRLKPGSRFEFALKSNVIARQLEIAPGRQPAFTAVLLDFGSMGSYRREGETAIYFTPKYMVPGEMAMRRGIVKKNFTKDPYTLGLLLLHMISGLEPFWHINLTGDTDEQIKMINILYESGEKPFDLELLKTLLLHNLSDIKNITGNSENLIDVILQNASLLLKGVFKEEITSIIAKMGKKLEGYYHHTSSRYQSMKRFSDHDEIWLTQGKSFRK